MLDLNLKSRHVMLLLGTEAFMMTMQYIKVYLIEPNSLVFVFEQKKIDKQINTFLGS